MLVDHLASSINMYHLIDPVLSKCTAQVPIAINTAIVASTGVQVISASVDPNLNHFDHYNQLLSSNHGDVSASGALDCALSQRRLRPLHHLAHAPIASQVAY